MSRLDQQEIICLLKNKEKEGFDRLYDTYSAALYKLSLHITRDAKLAQQVLENSFIFIWKNINTYTPSQISFGVWLVSIVKQEAANMGHFQVN
jgi:RNA polymerase sigma-70 factor (ECF subfamily)